jgi:hypothetical protein
MMQYVKLSMPVRQALSSLDDALLQDGFDCIFPEKVIESEPGWVCMHHKYCKGDYELWIVLARRLEDDTRTRD